LRTVLRKVGEAEMHEGCDRLTHNAAPQKAFAEPVTQLRGMPMHITTEANANAAGCRAVNLDAKICRRPFSHRPPQEFMRVINTVRMRKQIAQRESDFAIVCVLRERLCVIQSPRANDAAFQDEPHRLFRIEFDAGLLNFAIRQEPDKRFIMKVDNLDTVAPWIAKIAAKRRFQFQFVLFFEFLSNFRQLRFITNHDPEMAKICRLHLFHLENCEELVFAQFEEGIAFAAAHLFEIENVLVKRHRLLDVVDFDGHVIASINLHAHISA
jgi:hypothetical protein